MNQAQSMMESLGEGSGPIRNPILKKVYGVETFAELFGKIDPVIIKKATGWFINSRDKSMPVSIITKNDGILALGFQNGQVMALRATAIFPMQDMRT